MSSPTIQESASRMHCHPLQLLKEDEIKTASSILLGHLRNLGDSAGLSNAVHFKNISLHDPPKALLLPHLEAEASGVPLERRPYVPRCVDIVWSTENGREVRESTISLDSKSIIAQTQTGPGQYGPNDRFVSLPPIGCRTHMKLRMRCKV